MKAISFSPWQVMGTLPWQPDFSRHIQEGALLPGLTGWIPAQVPGCVYQDLHRAGWIPDPYYGENSLACEWVANRWWVYRTTFTLDPEDLEDTLFLRFEGIDYQAQIYLNGQKIGAHEGMYHPFETVVNQWVKPGKENVLVCVLEHAPFADPQPGYTSKTRYLKARFNYKWDFAVRLVSLGLYGPVTLTRHGLARIVHTFVRPVKKPEGWQLEIEAELDVRREGTAWMGLELRDPEGKLLQTVEAKLHLKEGSRTWRAGLSVDNPRLWWPNGYGEQALYSLRLALREGETLSDEREERTGFRTLEYRCADGRKDALPYNVVINGKRIYLKGTNMVPLDCMTGAVTPEELRRKLEAVRDANVNFLRIWGGGHLEGEDYYRLCDELGLMVLQEFPMSSSGCDDVPSRNPAFLELLHRAAVYHMKQKRSHVCLTFWDGGNELTDIRYLGRPDHEGHPATFEDSTLAMLRGLAESLCPDVQMLPSSASGPNALLNPDTPGQNHDVHGPWGFMGVEDHYALYNRSDSIVHGEFGCGGMSNYESVCRFTPEKDRRVATSDENRVWAHHSGGWDTYSYREQLLFGDLREMPLPDYIKISQFIQAEALRYALEANRRRQWRNVGQMTWQFNEPWPNMQCSNVLDYYGGKKLAYYAIQEAYGPVLASLRYDKLFYQPGEKFRAELHILSDRPDALYQISWEIAAGETLLASGKAEGLACEDCSQKAGDLEALLPEGADHFIVRLHTLCGSFDGRKEYLFLIPSRVSSVKLTELEERRLALFSRKPPASGPDAPRASVQPVLDYVDRWLAGVQR